MPRDGLNVLGQNVQYDEREQYESEILELRNHVELQDMLLRERMETAGGGVPGGAVAQVASTGEVKGPPAVRSQLLIVGGDQPTLADWTLRACWPDDPGRTHEENKTINRLCQHWKKMKELC